MSYPTRFILNLRQSGLALKAQVKDVAGADVGPEITTGFVPPGDGSYQVTLTHADGF
jgi:hypothetical protein